MCSEQFFLLLLLLQSLWSNLWTAWCYSSVMWSLKHTTHNERIHDGNVLKRLICGLSKYIVFVFGNILAFQLPTKIDSMEYSKTKFRTCIISQFAIVHVQCIHVCAYDGIPGFSSHASCSTSFLKVPATTTNRSCSSDIMRTSLPSARQRWGTVIHY